MLFNSLDFAIFLPIVFGLYWFVVNKNLRAQNVLVVAASYLFYGWWDWRFLSLIAASTLVDYFVGKALGDMDDSRKRKLLLWASLLFNLGLLGFFKYFNFFADNFASAFSFLGYDMTPASLDIILPVGISFYTFQTLSYTIDVYRRRLEPTRDLLAFAAFVSFFPQLVAGPIERAADLLPQFFRKRYFHYRLAVDGMRQILWGLFKKMVIADNCAAHADVIFSDPGAYSGSTLVLGALFFTFQIYGDFSGYSDIAIGTARLFGFKLRKNFAFPYFSRDIAEFWRRWHISLSTWFRDYLYIPLGGSRGGTALRIRNTFVIFLVSGFWHGANWTFIVWGALHALFFLPLLLAGKNRVNLHIVADERRLPSAREAWQMLLTFTLVMLAWVFFRSPSIGFAVDYLAGICSADLWSVPDFPGALWAVTTLGLTGLLVLVEWIGRRGAYGIQFAAVLPHRFQRWSLYAALVFLTALFMRTEETPFIYFQF